MELNFFNRIQISQKQEDVEKLMFFVIPGKTWTTFQRLVATIYLMFQKE